MLLLGSIFLLIWDYDRLKYILPFRQSGSEKHLLKKSLETRYRALFFGGVAAALAIIILGTFYLFEIGPGNSDAECRSKCHGSKNPLACQEFCNCIYVKGQPLDSCLDRYDRAVLVNQSNAK
jgi:hypothetical protein